MSGGRRAQKIAEAVREAVSRAILFELKDPRVQDVTVTRVEASGDLRSAKVYVSVMGDEAKQKLAMHGLRSSAGFLQSKIAQSVQTRYTPVLRFVLDQGVKQSIAISKLIDESLAESRAKEKEASSGGGAPDASRTAFPAGGSHSEPE